MTQQKTYLELSEGDSGSHKFYEVTVEGTQVTVRYGRIGDQGQSKTTDHPSTQAAQTDATKKINEKLRKGYEQAVQGGRKKRKVTRRLIEAAPPTTATTTTQRSGRREPPAPPLTQAPVLWRFASGGPALGIFINRDFCWVGNQNGRVFALDHQGQVLSQYQLPDGVKCLVSDDEWIYAGCDDGNVYDLGRKVPRIAYQIDEEIDILWLDIKDGVLGVADSAGKVTAINHEDESQWTRKGRGANGWMVRCDEIGIYHGHSGGVSMYDWEDGKPIWHQPTDGSVLFGWQEESLLFAGTANRKVHRFTKRGEAQQVYNCDLAVFSCAAAPDGEYVFAGDNGSAVYCFAADGTRLWKLATGCGSVYSMQFIDERLYMVTTDGSLACIDVSEAAIRSAMAGSVPTVIDIKAPKAEALPVSTALETTTRSDGGVVLECIVEDGRLRVRVASPGYHADWRVQFPKDLREAGARYVVESVRESGQGGFYRPLGEIKKLV